MNWDVICYALRHFEIAKMQRGAFNIATKLLLLDDNAVDLPGVLYVTDGSACSVSFRFALIVSTGPCCIRTENSIELRGASLSEVFNALMETKNHLDTLEGIFAQLDTDQELVDAAGMYLNCPLFYFDESYRVLAITRNVVFEPDGEWLHMLEHGYLSPENARRMQLSGDLDMLAATSTPVIYRSKGIYPYTSVVTNIFLDDAFASRVNLLCIRGAPNPVTLRACELLAACLKKNLLREQRTPAGGPLRSMLYDLLHDIPLSEILISDRLRTRAGWSDGLFRVFCVDVETRRDKQVSSYFSAVLEELCRTDDILALDYEEKLVLLAHANSDGGFDALIRKLSAFFEKHRLRGGMSNSFRRLRALRGCYEQALAALELSEGERLCFYRDKMLAHLLSFIPPDRAQLMISPDIERLQEVDANNGLQLTETLRAYLASNCNLTQTAEKLFVHKNTLLYRLSRIRSEIRSDLQDADERLLLSLSFKLLDR